MTKDSYLIFEAYSKSRTLTEAPVEMSSDYAGSGEELTASFPEQSKGKYDLSPEETSIVFSQFLSKFRARGGTSPKLFKDFYETELSPVVRSVKPIINNTNAKYTSRVLYNALKLSGILIDERDGAKGVKLEKKPSEKGVDNLTKFTLKNAGDLGEESVDDTTGDKGNGIDDPLMKRVWVRILDEGEYSREELARMFIDEDPDLDETDAKINVSALIRTGYLVKTEGGNFKAVDPEEQQEQDAVEGEGTGEVTAGYDPDEVEDWEPDDWGGVHVGSRKGEGSFD